MAKSDDTPTVTLIGQSKSGKTNLLAALLMNDNSLYDLTEGPDAIAVPRLTGNFDVDSPAALDRDFLRRHYTNMLRGSDDALQGTQDVRRYPNRLEFEVRTTKKGILNRKPQTTAEPFSLPFEIVDGRGGDVAPDEFILFDDDDENTRSRRQDYRDGLDASIGMIICMPISKTEFITEIAGRMMDEVRSALRRKSSQHRATPLKYVSLCFTKYETQFMEDLDFAAEHAQSELDFVELLSGERVLTLFRPLLSGEMEGQSFDVRIFAVSAFGFVGGTGRPNFYNYPPAPGLLTRTVDPILDWEDPDRQDYRDHFPFEVTDGEAETLWHPFNLAPPLLFALTGRETGPLCLSPEDLSRIESRLFPAGNYVE